ncbi:MAG TPA: molybdopterin cofactor-binding domain-containing protein [Candidatus Methylomirabilis sp.]|nr:molybdopterin cofactor-binding domain-containing protein [Candidatus Methylomirabilis sp.]
MAATTSTTGTVRLVGSAIRRREDRRLMTGLGTFVDDLSLPSMVEVALVRSPHAHARIRSIDASRARAARGVVAVLTGVDLEGVMKPVPCIWTLPDMKAPTRLAIARDKARFAGDIVAAVVATDRYVAWDAAELVAVDYEILAAVVDPEAAMQPGAPLLHDDVPQNTAFSWKLEGGDQSVFDTAPVKVRVRLVNQRLIPNSLEGRAVLAQWNPATGEATVWTSTQIPHLVRLQLSRVLDLPEHKLRVIAPEVGGGFGAKQNFYPEEMLTTSLAMRLKRPVKWVEQRRENFVATTHGRDHVQEAELVGMRDGTIGGLRVTSRANVGAYFSMFAPAVPTGLFGLMLSGAYRLPAVSCQVYGVLTNTTTVDAYRGAGRPEAAHLVERLVDMFAAEIRVDPAEVRRKNFIRPSEFPYTTITGVTYDSGNYEGALTRALELAGYADLRRQQAEARRAGRLVGIGLCSFVEICGIAPSQVLGAAGGGLGGWESSTVRVHPTGKVTVLTGSSAHGQGHETCFAQVAADELGVSIDDVEVVHGDTAQVPLGIGTFGSRSAAVGGSALVLSARKVKDKAVRIAAHLLEAAAADVVFEEGRFSVRGTPGRSISWSDVSLQAFLAHNFPPGLEPALEATTFFDPSNFTWPFGTHVCVTEVDRETGQIQVLRYVAVDDCGHVINPLIVDGQVHGGITQGLAQALYEGAEYDQNGQLLTGSFMDYAIPTAVQTPSYETAHTVTPAPHNPLGVKGIGEAGTIAASAAVVNSVVDALGPLGIRHLDMPLKPERIWRTIEASRAAKRT